MEMLQREVWDFVVIFLLFYLVFFVKKKYSRQFISNVCRNNRRKNGCDKNININLREFSFLYNASYLNECNKGTLIFFQKYSIKKQIETPLYLVFFLFPLRLTTRREFSSI